MNAVKFKENIERKALRIIAWFPSNDEISLIDFNKVANVKRIRILVDETGRGVKSLSSSGERMKISEIMNN